MPWEVPHPGRATRDAASFPAGAALRARLLQCLHHAVVLAAADVPRGPQRGDGGPPAPGAAHHAEHALQAADHLRQRRLRLHGRRAPRQPHGPPQRLRAQPQAPGHLRAGMRAGDAQGRAAQPQLHQAPALGGAAAADEDRRAGEDLGRAQAPAGRAEEGHPAAEGVHEGDPQCQPQPAEPGGDHRVQRDPGVSAGSCGRRERLRF
ncbi:hypothetical protein RLOC_00002757 [Lonchura striata]|uniref:Uncharacterized protein n=1 Tax=Lonchura striata TaxID=40157 RepID=A0A218UDL5_9PASE|nr:hypothetical protein RLOC_00002757 [Lonchura striata domestica]